jgi:hypothetical protein
MQVGSEYRQLRAQKGGRFYWVASSGGRLLRGDEFDTVEESQPSVARR